jgi:hypothetical protein
MKYLEREAIIEGLPYEARLGFIGYCVERCLAEARRHPAASAHLAERPMLVEGTEMLWARAERGAEPDPERVRAIREHITTYERPVSDENMGYTADVILVHTAKTLNRGMRLLQDPKVRVGAVARALEGPLQTVSAVYADWQAASAAEVANVDDALVRLKDWDGRRFSRTVFDGIADWTRGKVSPKYAAGRITGTDVELED